mgnify:CR=1 FL=1
MVAVDWQSVVLNDGTTTEDASSRLSVEQGSSVAQRSERAAALMVRDDLLGVSVTVNESHRAETYGAGSQRDAHAITLHSQSQQGYPLHAQFGEAPSVTSSLVLASDSVGEVVDIYLRQAQAYCDENQWEKAFNACQEALKVAPATAEAYKFLGKILQQQGRPTDAMGFYAKAITIRPNFPEVYVNLGSMYAQKGQLEEAVSYYQKAIDRDPTMATAYLNLAKVWKKAGRKDSEMNCMATALRLQPDLGSAQEHCRIAQLLESANDSERAVQFYQQAVEQDPKMVVAYQRLADLLEDGGDWQAAAVCYRKVLALNAEAERANSAESPSVGMLAGKLSPEAQQQVHKLLQASTTKKLLRTTGSAAASLVATEASEQAQLSLSPAEAAALSPTEQAQRYVSVKDWPRAIECMQAAIVQAPQSAILYRSLAKLFEQNGEPKRGAEAWYRSFVLEPSWPDAQQCYSLGRVLFRYGSMAAATQCYRQSIQLQPEFAPSYDALAELLRSQGNSQDADMVLQRRPIPIKKHPIKK